MKNRFALVAILAYALAISGCEPSRIQELETQVSELETKVSDLESQLSEKQAEIGEFEEKLSEIQNNINSLESSMTELEREVSDFNYEDWRNNVILPKSWTKSLVKKVPNFTKRYDQTNPPQIFARV